MISSLQKHSNNTIRFNNGINTSQTVIQMEKSGGVYKVPCEINGFKVNMVFDTGASAVTISSALAQMLLKNGLLSEEDIVGQAQSITADGRMVDHTDIILKTIKIGDITLNNVNAIVIDRQEAQLLLGQSAIQQMGDVTIKGNKLYINYGTNSINGNTERWDSRKYSYTNYSYGFGWTLPRVLEWERIEGQEKHTPFRVEAGPIVAFVNVQENGTGDLWPVFEQLKSKIAQLDVSHQEKTGQIIYDRTFEKCTLIGQNAIKTTFCEYLKDSRFDEAVESYAEEYMLILNGYTITLAVKIIKSFYDENETECKEFISDIFKGFRVATKQ